MEYIFSDSRGNVYKIDCSDRDAAAQLAYKCGLSFHGSTINLLRTGQFDLINKARRPIYCKDFPATLSRKPGA